MELILRNWGKTALNLQNIKGPSQIDFHDPDAVRELTASLLKRDFNLTVNLPNDRLCPPVPNRLNYILWLQDLLDSTSGRESDDYDPEREVIGLDIGVGASCIYPLLGCATRPNWKFVGTDIDPFSLHHAHTQLALNNLSTRVHLILTQPTTPFFSLPLLAAPRLDFTMCNPPFYHSPTPPPSTQTPTHPTHLPTPTPKLLPPNSTSPQATQSEMSSPGGELPFVLRILRESALPDVRTRVQWFSVMLGLKSHIAPLVEEIKKLGGEGANFAVTTFVQGRGGKRGSGTRRWGVAWSWVGWRPGWGSGVCGVKWKGVWGKVKPFKGLNEILVPVGKGEGQREGEDEEDKVKQSVIGIIEDLAKSTGGKEVKWSITNSKTHETLITLWVTGDIWSRTARRRRARAAVTDAAQDNEEPQVVVQGRDTDENSLKGMVFRITISPASSQNDGGESAPGGNDSGEPASDDEDTSTPVLQLQDVYDYTPPHPHASAPQSQKKRSGVLITLRLIRCNPADTVLFESFCGMVRRKVFLKD